MMASKDNTQQLIDRRNKLLAKASEARNADELIECYSKNAVFHNVYQNITITGTEALHTFYSSAYTAIPTFKISSSNSTGTAEFVASEMECHGTAGVDLPQMGLEAGAVFKLRGVSLFWWQWEGEGPEWVGGLDDKSVSGWKIVQERAYFQICD